MKRRSLKKYNKGFSLVELIVVVLIMAIIAPKEFVDEFYKQCGGRDAVSNIKLKQKDYEAIITVNKGDVVRTKAPSEKAGQ